MREERPELESCSTENKDTTRREREQVYNKPSSITGMRWRNVICAGSGRETFIGVEGRSGIWRGNKLEAEWNKSSSPRVV